MYRVNVLSISVEMVSPSQLGLGVHTVYWRGLRLPVGHLSDVIRNRWRQTSHHVTSGELTGEVCLVLVSLPPPAEMKSVRSLAWAELSCVFSPPHTETDQGEEDDDDGGHAGPDGHGQDLPVNVALVAVEVPGALALSLPSPDGALASS